MTHSELRMTNQPATPHDELTRSPKRPLALLFGHPFVILFSGLVIAAGLLAAAGCGMPRQTEPKPDLYRVAGRVLDAHTKEPLTNVRIRLRAVLPVNFDASRLPVYGDKKPTGSGTIPLTSYGYTKADGKYEVELPEKPEVIQRAIEIQVDASIGGYELGTCDVPPPLKPQPVYTVQDIYLVPRSPTGQPAGTRPNPVTKPIPWK
jgi:hypothetical protein